MQLPNDFACSWGGGIFPERTDARNCLHLKWTEYLLAGIGIRGFWSKESDMLRMGPAIRRRRSARYPCTQLQHAPALHSRLQPHPPRSGRWSMVCKLKSVQGSSASASESALALAEYIGANGASGFLSLRGYHPCPAVLPKDAKGYNLVGKQQSHWSLDSTAVATYSIPSRVDTTKLCCHSQWIIHQNQAPKPCMTLHLALLWSSSCSIQS